MPEARINKVLDALGSVVGGAGPASSPASAQVLTSFAPAAYPELWPACTPFLAAVAQGMPLAEALDAFAHVGCGQFSHDDRRFCPENAVRGPVADRIRLLHRAERRVACGREGEADMTLFLFGGAIAALVSGKRLRARGWRRRAETRAASRRCQTSSRYRETRTAG
jgi:hypothetical protein